MSLQIEIEINWIKYLEICGSVKLLLLYCLLLWFSYSPFELILFIIAHIIHIITSNYKIWIEIIVYFYVDIYIFYVIHTIRKFTTYVRRKFLNFPFYSFIVLLCRLPSIFICEMIIIYWVLPVDTNVDMVYAASHLIDECQFTYKYQDKYNWWTNLTNLTDETNI